MAKYAIWDTYFSALNLVEWGIPEKIKQNAVQSQSKVTTKSHFCTISPLLLWGSPA